MRNKRLSWGCQHAIRYQGGEGGERAHPPDIQDQFTCSQTLVIMMRMRMIAVEGTFVYQNDNTVGTPI